MHFHEEHKQPCEWQSWRVVEHQRLRYELQQLLLLDPTSHIAVNTKVSIDLSETTVNSPLQNSRVTQLVQQHKQMLM